MRTAVAGWRPSPWLGYPAALGFVLLAAAVRSLLPLQQLPYLLFIPAVFAASLAFGRGPGLFATGASTGLAVWLFIGPQLHWRISPSAWLSTSLYFVVCVGFALVCGRLKEAAAVREAEIVRVRALDVALRESEARFRLIADSAPVPMWVTGLHRGRDFVNRAYLDFAGLPYEDALTLDWRTILHPDDRERVEGEQARYEAALHPFTLEARYRDAEGRYRWMRSQSQPKWDAEGRHAGFIGVAYDVTPAKEAARSLEEMNATLEARVEERTRERDRLWRLSEDLLKEGDHEDGLVRVSPSWMRLLGREEAVYLHGRHYDFIHPDDLSAVRSAHTQMREDGRPVSLEYRMRTAEGEWRWISWRLTAEAGHRRFTGVGRDVTDVRAREAELQQVQEALRQSQKLEAVGQLTGGIAHDFNNLLTIIRSSVEFLRREDVTEARRRRYVAAISDTVERAARLTGQLLAFARRQPLKPEPFDVGERVRVVVDLLRPLMGSGVAIEVNTEEDGYALADVGQFETALVNLAVNARDAMDGRGRLTIRTGRAGPGEAGGSDASGGEAGGRPDLVSVTVSDTGAGVAPENLARIFEPFFTTKQVGRGTGLGLSQVFGFAKQSGGEVEVRPWTGEGASFTLYLPRAEPPPASPEVAATPTPPAPAAPPRTAAGRPHVLVVEDDEDVRQASTDILRDLGYRTRTAGEAQSALAMLDEGGAESFDLVFSDVIMPGMNGVEFARIVRERHPDLPVVLTSGYSHVLAEEGRHGFELVQKPYSVATLSRVLHRVLSERAAAAPAPPAAAAEAG